MKPFFSLNSIYKVILSLVFSSTLLLSSSASVFAADPKAYSDIPNDGLKPVLVWAVSNDILVGTGDKILPSNHLKRAEMAAIINRVFGATQKGDITKFTDIPPESWYAEDLAKALKMGTLQGYADKMRPEDPITRQEAFAVIARAFKLTTTDYNSLDKYSDKSNIGDWALSCTAVLTTKGYIHDKDSKINPADYMTRGEFAEILYNMVKGYIKTPGIYTTVPEGNLVINVPGVTIKGVVIKGDLIIGEGVGTGDVTLDAVKIEGRTLIRGGGANSIHIVNGTNIGGSVIIDNINNEVRIVTDTGTTVQRLEARSQVVLEGIFGEVTVLGDTQTPANLEIRGTIQNLAIESKAEVVLVRGSVTNINIANSTGGTTINTSEGTSIGTIIANSPFLITGNGNINNITANAGNIVVETPNTTVTVQQGVTGVTLDGNQVPGGTTSTNKPTKNTGSREDSSPSRPSEPDEDDSPSPPSGPLDVDRTGDYTVTSAGTYGPASGTATITGNVTINADGVILRNIAITGNLTFDAAIGDGDATIINVAVGGYTLVNGGGSNSIHIQGASTPGVIKVDDQREDKSNPINIAAEGTGIIEAISVVSPAEVMITAETDTIEYVAADDGSIIHFVETPFDDDLFNKIVEKANEVLDAAFVDTESDYTVKLNPELGELVLGIVDTSKPRNETFRIGMLKYYINPLEGVATVNDAVREAFEGLQDKLFDATVLDKVIDMRENPERFNPEMNNMFLPNQADPAVLVNGPNFGMSQTMLNIDKAVYDRLVENLGKADPGDEILNSLKNHQTISALHSVTLLDTDGSLSVNAGDKLAVVFKRQLTSAGHTSFESLIPMIDPETSGSFGDSPVYTWDKVPLQSMSGEFEGDRCTITLGDGVTDIRNATLTFPKTDFGSFAPEGFPTSIGWLTNDQPVFDIVITIPDNMLIQDIPTVYGAVYAYDRNDSVSLDVGDSIGFTFNCSLDQSSKDSIRSWFDSTDGDIFGAAGEGEGFRYLAINTLEGVTKVEIGLGTGFTVALSQEGTPFTFTIPGPLLSEGGGEPAPDLLIQLPTELSEPPMP